MSKQDRKPRLEFLGLYKGKKSKRWNMCLTLAEHRDRIKDIEISLMDSLSKKMDIEKELKRISDMSAWINLEIQRIENELEGAKKEYVMELECGMYGKDGNK